MLQERQAVDGALVDKVLPIGCCKHFNGDGPLVQRAAVHRAVSATSNQLKRERKRKKRENRLLIDVLQFKSFELTNLKRIGQTGSFVEDMFPHRGTHVLEKNRDPKNKKRLKISRAVKAIINRLTVKHVSKQAGSGEMGNKLNYKTNNS